MAYKIGSEKGKKIAEEMKAGETYEASDGSVWTKENDGSVTVRTSGNTYKNAYTPTTPTVSNTPKTSNYSPYSGGIDLGDQGKGQMAADAPWQDVLLTATNRYDKAINTPGLEQYSDDDLQREMMMYVQNKIAEENAAKENAPVSQGGSNRPEHKSKYSKAADQLINKIINQDKFSYDPTKSSLYKQYAKMYQREGDRAMRDTLAEVAMGAGGMNSYAVTAAQQAQNYYNSQLNDRIPELYQLAYDMYLADKESKIQDLGILQNMDATQYARYRDTMSDWENDRNFAYGVYQDDITQQNWLDNFNYNKFLNAQSQGNWEKEFYYNKALNSEKNQQNTTGNNDARYAQENAQDMLQFLLKEGYTPDANIIAAAGYDPESVQTWFGEGDDNVDDNGDDNVDDAWTSGLDALGLPRSYGPEAIVFLADEGYIRETNDGRLEWKGEVTKNAGKTILEYKFGKR